MLVPVGGPGDRAGSSLGWHELSVMRRSVKICRSRKLPFTASDVLSQVARRSARLLQDGGRRKLGGFDPFPSRR